VDTHPKEALLIAEQRTGGYYPDTHYYYPWSHYPDTHCKQHKPGHSPFWFSKKAPFRVERGFFVWVYWVVKISRPGLTRILTIDPILNPACSSHRPLK
jgi:hypothetical protein